MNIIFITCFFILGIVLGSFYNVVGYRLPRGESIVRPRSHCPKCKHILSPIELIPIFSYIIQGGKCKNCHVKISPFYAIFEFLTGLLFVVSYLVFGINLELLLALTFISMLIIIIISDYQTYIISDEVLVVFTIILCILKYLIGGPNLLFSSILNGLISFTIMFLIKKMGDFLFKKESMGGGDIKLLFIIGFMFEFKMAIVIIFLGSIIALPISLIILSKKNTNIIPYGPFLAIASMIVLLLKIDFNKLLMLFY